MATSAVEAAVATKTRELLWEGAVLVDISVRPGTEAGLDVEQRGAWALVVHAPPGAKVQRGDALAAVDGDDVLLGSYEAMFARVLHAKTSQLPYTLTFRRAPVCRGWLRKKPRESGTKDGHRSLGGWRTRWFELGGGELVYYDKAGGARKGAFGMEGCVVTLTEELELVCGAEQLVLAAAPDDLVQWAAWLRIAAAHAAGGDALLREVEGERLAAAAARRRGSRRYSRAPQPGALAAAA